LRAVRRRKQALAFIINIAEVHFKYVSLDSLVEAVKFEAAQQIFPWCSTSTTACILTPWCAPWLGSAP
jgi:hypothetical protein